MIHAKSTKRRGHSVIWILSVVLGVSLALRASTPAIEFASALAPRAMVVAPVAASPAAASRLALLAAPAATPAKAATLPMICRIPADLLIPEIKALSHDIARHFHVAESVASSITHAAFVAADRRGLDPTLVLAVAAVESKFKPGAFNSTTGARGLMQVMAKWHPEKVSRVGGEPSLMLIAPNISVGAAILAEYLDKQDGNLNDALERYLGVGGADHYVQRVRLEMEHLAKVIKAA